MPFLETPNIRVDRVDSYGSEIVLVSFAERKTHTADLAEKGWGQDFASFHRIDGFYIKSAGNHWYQYPEMKGAMAAIREAAGSQHLVTYGCSMGAYAAIKFAGALGAKRAVAVSPLFTPDPSKPPYEQRWKVDASRTAFIDDEMDGTPEVHVFILSDPTHPDARHTKLLRRTFPRTTVVPLPFASHPVGPFLREAELLTEFTLRLLYGNFDNRVFCDARRARRSRSQIYLERRKELLAGR
ncbi:hypothetical protein IVB18_38250 [Bradyrhizobium sp. 186]|uniref:hypothetical protein n=1 Tax=Bradyrhizobium sp. 186 TaxID=2782654 RepID=UPI002001BCBB|nr:hypothetical protein [Bradyrhizobium sp. 186]UPK33963.1 hypothetical protein IVB18_38250 [Bradyrhizobium sp. 186]